MPITIMRKLTALLLTGILLTGFLPTGSAVKAEIYGGELQMDFSEPDLQYFAFIDKKNDSLESSNRLSPDDGPALEQQGNSYLLSNWYNLLEGVRGEEINMTNIVWMKIEIEWHSLGEWEDGSVFSMVGLNQFINETSESGTREFYWHGNDTIANNNWITGKGDYYPKGSSGKWHCNSEKEPEYSDMNHTPYLASSAEECFEFSFFEYFPESSSMSGAYFDTGFDGDCEDDGSNIEHVCVEYSLTLTAETWSIREEPTLEANGGISQKYTYCDNTVELFMVSSDGDTVTVSPQGTWSPVLALLKDIEFSLDENDDYRYKYRIYEDSINTLCLFVEPDVLNPNSNFQVSKETIIQINPVGMPIREFAAIWPPVHKIHINGETGYPICKNNGTEIEFTGVNNGNFQDTFEVLAVNGDYLETKAGIDLEFTARQYMIDASGEYPIRVNVNASEEGTYSLNMSIRTVLQGYDASDFHISNLIVTECSPVEEVKIPEIIPVALAGKDITVKEGENVQFSGAGTRVNGSIVFYEWDFDGDGVFEWSSEDNGITTFLYNDGGEYITTLRVTDSEGNTAIDNRTITVIADPTEGSEGKDDSESSTPSISLLTSIISIGLLAIFRRK